MLDPDFARTYFEHLLRTEEFDACSLRQYQLELLEGIIRHAYDTSPFYKERLAPLITKRGNVDLTHWDRVRLLTRDELRENRDALLSRAVPEDHGRFYRISTSGTTGIPISVTATRLTEAVRRAAVWRTHLNHGFDWSRQFAIALRRRSGQANWPEGSRARLPWGPPWLTPPGPPRVQINGATSVDRIAEWLGRNGAKYFASLPITLAAVAEEPSAVQLGLHKLLSFGMAVKAEHRETVRNRLGIDIVELYGSEDCGPIAHPCPEYGNLHVMSELLLIEIVDDGGKHCPAGATGRVLVTAFHNFAQPIIRYEIGDVAAFGEPCACGRTHPVIGRIPGRSRDMFRRADGSKFTGYSIDGLFPPSLCVKWWQVAQTGAGKFEARVVSSRDITADDSSWVEHKLRQSWDWQADISLKRLERIPYAPGQKHIDFVYEAD
ncbi:MAG: phenylacetate--CoA ligase family protein [Aestuariivirga sp.]